MPKETVQLTEIETEILAVFVLRKIIDDSKIVEILDRLADKLES